MEPSPTSTDLAKRVRRRWWAIPLAILAAFAGAWVAPRPWTPGPVRLLIEDGETVVFEEVVQIGASGRRELADGAVILEDGLPIDGAFHIRFSGGTRARLVRDDGFDEILPAQSVGKGWSRATRRPPWHARAVLALLGAVVVLWITELIPLFVTSLAIPVVLAATGAASATGALAPFFDPIIVLFFAGFILAQAMHRVGLDRWVATGLVATMGTSPVRLYAALLAVSAFLSMWMSNTAAVTVLLPVAMAVTAPFTRTGYRKAAVLGIAYAATIGGVGSAIGTPANQLAIRFVEDMANRSISFAEWFVFGLPFVVVFLPVMGIYLWRISGVHVDADEFDKARHAAAAERVARGDLTGVQWQVLAVFGLVMALWLTEGWHGLNTGIVALGGAVVLFAIGRVVPADLGRISWATLLTFGGGLTLGIAMVDSGISDWIVTRLGRMEGTSEILSVLAVAGVALFLTTVASNTAAAATLIPLAIPLAAVLHVDPVLLALTVAMATSIDFALVIGTPPTMLAYGTGMFTTGEVLRKGLPLDLIGLLILVAIALSIWPAFL